MKTWKFVTVLVLSLIFNYATNANAIQVKMPTGACPTNSTPNIPPHALCAGGYTLNDMGYFDQNGVWVWNPYFYATADIALRGIPSFSPNWEDVLRPVIVDTPPRITSGRVDHRSYAAREPEIRLAFQAAGTAKTVSYIKLYLEECYKTGIDVDAHETSTPCYSDPDVMRVKVFWAQLPNGPPVPTVEPITQAAQVTMNDIASVRWVEKNLHGTPYMAEIQNYQSITYNLSKNFWNPLQAWAQVTDLLFTWKPIPSLTLGETTTFEITLKSGIIIQTASKVQSLNPLPLIPSTITGTDYNILKEKDKKSGKIVIKAEEVQVTTNNITVREVGDPSGGKALVIQWPEPDIALFGGADMPTNTAYQVRAYIGVFPSPADLNGTKEVFLMYDLPAQMGTCVVEFPSYESLLLKMQELGYAPSDLRVLIQYREVYNRPGELSYQNRSYTSLVPINTP
jgi:hypothetical protein